MTLLNKPISVLGLIGMMASCGMVGEEAVTIPAYISVPSYTFVTDTSSPNAGIYQGLNSEKFTDMWISDAGKLVGEVGLPSLIPIQKTGPTQIWVEAGIIITGQDEQRESYPLMSQHIETRNLQPGVIDTVYPVFKYLPNIDFKFIEDFDRPGSFMRYDPDKKPQDTVIRVTDVNSWKPGNAVGKIQMDTAQTAMQLLSNEYTLPQSGSPVYLEIDYKSNLQLDIGYYYNEPGSPTGVSPSNSVVRVYPNGAWKKLYVKLTDEVATRKPGTTYVIYIAVLNPDKTVTDVYIDNVKLVCLKG